MTLADAARPTLEGDLVTALHQIGTDACRDAADRFAQGASGAGDVSVHLRRAGITTDGAKIIAQALTLLPEAQRARLRSFSLSYNDIGDTGAIALAAALPPTLNELGMVGCALGDPSGAHLLGWAAKAHGLDMICIEGNQLSQDMRDGFLHLRTSSPGLSVYV